MTIAWALSRLAPSGVTLWQRSLGAPVRGTSANHLGGLNLGVPKLARLHQKLSDSVGLRRQTLRPDRSDDLSGEESQRHRSLQRIS